MKPYKLRNVSVLCSYFENDDVCCSMEDHGDVNLPELNLEDSLKRMRYEKGFSHKG